MFSTVLSATLRGLQVQFIQVEADVSNGLPMFHMVGYLSSEVKEAGERVRTAIRNSGFGMPPMKVVVNLSPANVRKKGNLFDLPIAVSVLAALGQISEPDLANVLLVGELSLDGSVKGVKGILPIVMEAKQRNCRFCIVPQENQREAELVQGISIIGVETLEEVCKILNGEAVPKKVISEALNQGNKGFSESLDYRDVKGQKIAKRAAEIAVAGGHNLLLIGAYGSGKSMIAKRLPTILPPLTLEESMELTKIYSIVGELDSEEPLITCRPFREVHHSVTKAALAGGGHIPRPGEISLAHKGVLFLDEIAEFQKPTLELLRQPLEEHQIKILRERGEYEFPAEFLLVAAMNPCPCGNYPDLNKCTCTATQIQNYLGKISQPLLDRIDLCVEVEKVEYEDLTGGTEEENSEEIRKRVVRAREIQKERYSDFGILTNAQLKVSMMEKFCRLGTKEEEMMRKAFERLELSARAYYKVLGVARTVADLSGEEDIQLPHLQEALCYRTIDKKYWGGRSV